MLSKPGFAPTDSDTCVFHRNDNSGNKCTIALHVDDLLVTYTNPTLPQGLDSTLNRSYGRVKTQQGRNVTYLGMSLTINSDGSISLSMPASIEELIRLHHNGSKADTPATKHLFRCEAPGTPEDRHSFLSLIMKLMYLAERTRQDLLLACSHLATRSHEVDTHADGKGHTGLIFTMGPTNGFIFAKSVKQKCVSRTHCCRLQYPACSQPP